MNDWTFETKDIASTFDSHVREQLPWYELVTESVAYIVRNYLPTHGLIYDVGSSTGNMTRALRPLLDERNATLIALESSHEMCEAYRLAQVQRKRDYLIECDATDYPYDGFDVAVVFLTAMFMPVERQEQFIRTLVDKLNKGGAIIIVDKACDDSGYFATVMKRLTMYWKLKNGANAEDIISKELSLSGVQRPLANIEQFGGKQFFQLGEFKGWVIEK